jgi:hypothetical protein
MSPPCSFSLDVWHARHSTIPIKIRTLRWSPAPRKRESAGADRGPPQRAASDRIGRQLSGGAGVAAGKNQPTIPKSLNLDFCTAGMAAFPPIEILSAALRNDRKGACPAARVERVRGRPLASRAPPFRRMIDNAGEARSAATAVRASSAVAGARCPIRGR